MNMSRTVIDAAIEYIRVLFQNNYGGHDAAHTLRVYGNAMLIAENVKKNVTEKSLHLLPCFMTQMIIRSFILRITQMFGRF